MEAVLRLALSFLTILPIRAPDSRPEDLGRAAAWFPAVGLVLGALLVAARWALGWLFPPLLAAALVVALWAALTGGLHLDGLADCGDGLLAAVPPARRLEIMRDPRLGTFGGLSLCLFILLKILAVAALPVGPARLYALVLAPALARGLMLLTVRQPSARPGGLGAAFALGLTPAGLLAAAGLPLVLVLLGGWRAAAAAGLALLVTLAVLGLARRRLGGVTGDVFGLTVEMTELAVLLAYAAGA